MNIDNEVCKRLLKIRNILDLIQEEIALRIGISRTLYIDYENGRAPLSKKSLDKIASNLNVNLDWLLQGIGEIFIGGNSIIDKSRIAKQPMPLSYSNATITSLIEQNHQLVKQVSDLIEMQKLNAQTINNLSKLGIEHQQREMNSS